MARMTSNTNTLTSAAWAGDWLSREHVVPGGAQLDPAAITADANGHKPVPSGTLVGRTIAERDAGTPYGLAADADDEVYLIAFDVTDALQNNDIDLYRTGSIVKENFLPNFASLSTALKTKVRAQYICTRGAS